MKVVWCIALFAVGAAAFAQQTAKAAAAEAAKKNSLAQSVDYLRAAAPGMATAADRRALYAFLGSVQEQMGQYGDAEKSYAQAAAIVAGDAPGMPRKSSEQLVLDAVRCALCLGDYKTAESYLGSDVRKTTDGTTKSFVRLYTQWARLCRAETEQDVRAAVATLKTYVDLPAMAAVEPAVLLTIWHLTGEESFAAKLKSKYPKSPEAGIVKGEIQQLPTPFWFFVPRTGNAVSEIRESKITETKNQAPTTEKAVRQQLGLFRDEANAKYLVDSAKAKGFAAYITTEVRPSGTTYYLVVVNENSAGTVGNDLRNAGFDCYPVFD